MPNIGDTWTPSMPFPETERERWERKEKEREEEREKNRIKNLNRRAGKDIQRKLPQNRVEAGKKLRHAFGGAFGHAPENVKFMAAQGTTMSIDEGDNNEE